MAAAAGAAAGQPPPAQEGLAVDDGTRTHIWGNSDAFADRANGILEDQKNAMTNLGDAAAEEMGNLNNGWARLIPANQDVDLQLYMDDVRAAQEAENRQRNVRILDPIEPSETNNSIMSRYNAIEDFFFGGDTLDMTDYEILRLIRTFFGVNNDDEVIKGEKVRETWEARVKLIEDLMSNMQRRKLASMDASNVVAHGRMIKLQSMQSLIQTAYTGIVAIENYRDCSDRRNRLKMPPTAHEILNQPMLDAKGQPKQANERHRVITFLLAYCQEHRLRKDRQGLGYYKEIKTEGGVGTHAWKYMGELEKLPFEAVRPRSANPEIWRCLVYQSGIARHAVEYLSKCTDHELPELVKSRRIWAFPNGVYIGFQDQFYEHGDPRLHDGIVACKYFPVEFQNEKYVKQSLKDGNNYPDWWNIETPLVDQILKDQNLDRDVIAWFYILCGRLPYKIRELDGWQVQMFIKGIAGTGKSSLLQQLIYMWDPVDVGYISNTVERNFPLEGLLHVFVYFGLDVSSQMGLDQTLWQSMVTGEGIAVTRKFKSRISIDWETPGALAGNQTPPWKDNAGSVSRRLLILEFMRTISEGASKPHLQDDMRNDIGAFIKKICCAYNDVGLHEGLLPIWSLLPLYFKMTRENLRKETNLLESFITGNECAKNDAYRIPMVEFHKQFRIYCMVIKEQRPPGWVPEYYTGVLHHHNLKIKHLTNAEYRGRVVPGKVEWVMGIDLAMHVSEYMDKEGIEANDATAREYDQEVQRAHENLNRYQAHAAAGGGIVGGAFGNGSGAPPLARPPNAGISTPRGSGGGSAGVPADKRHTSTISVSASGGSLTPRAGLPTTRPVSIATPRSGSTIYGNGSNNNNSLATASPKTRPQSTHSQPPQPPVVIV